MIDIIIRKKDLKEAISITKRVLGKTDKVRLFGEDDLLFVQSVSSIIEVYDYLPLVSAVESFAIEVDPIILDKWLDKADRDMHFQLSGDTLTCVEKKESMEIRWIDDEKISFFDARTAPFYPFQNQSLFLNSFAEANKTFYPYDRKYADYAKLTDNNFFIYNPMITSIFFLQENLGLNERFGIDGMAIHKNAIDVLMKSVKNPKGLTRSITKKNFLLRNENTIFALPLQLEVSFPDIRTALQALPDKKYDIQLDVEDVSKTIQSMNEKTVTKVIFDKNEEQQLVISCDDETFEPILLSLEYLAPRSIFHLPVINSFLEGLTGTIQIKYTEYDSISNKNAYLWKFQDKEKSKIIPGIKEAPGFKQK